MKVPLDRGDRTQPIAEVRNRNGHFYWLVVEVFCFFVLNIKATTL
jgi:hypothetical protein